MGGQPRNGTFELIFAITNMAGDQFWGETNASVDVNNGLFNVVLGNITPFGTDVFPLDAQATNRWLGVRVAGQPLTPGQQFISMPYALLANNAFALDGITAANLSYATNALIGATNALNLATNALNLATNALQVQVKDLQDATNELNKATNALNLATNSLQVQVKDLQDATNELNKATNALNLATNSLQVQAKQLQDATNALNIATNALQVQIYSLSNTVGYVVGPAGRASYQTIQAAINAAVAVGHGRANPVTIEVKPGEYTEDLTLFAGIHLKAEIEDALFSVRVIGVVNNHDYNYTDVNNLGDLFISGIWFDSPAAGGTAPILRVRGAGPTSIRMNHCVINSRANHNGLALSLENTGAIGGRLSNTEMSHCRIRNLRADFTGAALVVLDAGSLLLDDGEATLEDNAEIAFLSRGNLGASQLLVDNAQIRGRIDTRANNTWLQITQSSIDSGAQPCIVHNGGMAIALEVLLISTRPAATGPLVIGNAFFLYNNLAFFNSVAVPNFSQDLNQTLATTLSGGRGALPLRTESATNLIYRAAVAADWTGFGGAPNNVNLALNRLANGTAAHIANDNNMGEEAPTADVGDRGEPTRAEIEQWGDVNDWDQDDHALVIHTDNVGITVETDPTVTAGWVKDGVTWAELKGQGMPAGFTDDVDNVGGIISEDDPQVGANIASYVPRWDGSALVKGSIYDLGSGFVTIPDGLYVPWIQIFSGDFRIRTPANDQLGNDQFLALRAYESPDPNQARTVLVPAYAGFRITERENVDINLDLDNDGNLSIRGTYWPTSDSRMKANQEPLNYGLADVMKLQPMRFLRLEWTMDQETEEIEFDETTAETDFGLIAQDVYEIMPEAVKKPGDEGREYWGLAYDKLVAVLVNAIQEQQKTIGNQQAQIESLKGRVAALEQR